MIYLVYDSEFTNLLDVINLDTKEEKKEFEKKNKTKILIKADDIDSYINVFED